MRFKYLKYLAFALGGLSTVIAAGALYLHATFDGVRLAAELSHFAKQHYQRGLKFDGPLALSMFPRLAVRLPAGSLSGRSGEGELLGFEEARVGVRLLPLLAHRVAVDRVELVGLRLALQRGPDGRLNAADLLAGPPAEGSPVDLEGASLEVRGGTVSWTDELAVRRLALSELAVSTGRLERQGDGQLALEARLVQAAPVIDGRLAVHGAYRLDGSAPQLRNLQVSFKGALAGQPALDVEAAVAGLLLPQGAAPRLEQATLLVRGRLAGAPCEFSASAPRLVLSAAGPVATSLEASFRIDGAGYGGTWRSRVAGLRATSGAVGADQLSVEMAWHSAQGRLSGTLTSPAGWQRGVLALPALEGTLDWVPPRAAPLKVAVKAGAQVDFATATAAGRLDLRAAGSRLQGSWRVPRLAPLALGFDVEVDRVNLDALRAAAAGPAPASAARLDLASLRGLELDGVLRIGSLQAAGLHLERLRVPLTLAGGRLVSQGHVASLYGGSVEGSLTLAADGNRVAYRSYLQHARVGPLLHDASGKEAFSGLANLFVDLRCSAATGAECGATLEGLARVRLNDGIVRGIDMGAALKEWRSLIAGRQSARRSHRESEGTALDEVTASFRIGRGVAHSSDLQARSGLFRISGAGDIDLPAGHLDLLSRVTLLGLPGGPDSGLLAGLRGLGVPIRVKGPLARPEWQLEPGLPEAALAGVMKVGKTMLRGVAGARPPPRAKAARGARLADRRDPDN